MTKKIVDSQPFFYFGLKMLRLIGQDPTKWSKSSTYLSSFFIGCYLFLTFWCIFTFVLKEEDLQTLSKQMQGFSAIIFVS